MTSPFVFICGGEKGSDAVAATGLCATCAPGGEGKWRDEYSESLRGLDICILPDNDETGELHAWKVSRSLAGIAKSVSIVRLPGITPKGDVYDYLTSGGTAEELVRLAETASIREARSALVGGYQSPEVIAALSALDEALKRFR